jgi:hypothetical protein
MDIQLLRRKLGFRLHIQAYVERAIEDQTLFVLRRIK